MTRLLTGVAVLLLAACSVGPRTTTIPTAPGGDEARAQLCNATGDASLAGLAGHLDAFDPATTDTSSLQLGAGSVAAALIQLNVTGDQATLRDAAVAAVQQVQRTTLDEQTAREAASAIRGLEGSLC